MGRTPDVRGEGRPENPLTRNVVSRVRRAADAATPEGGDMASSAAENGGSPIRVGVIADQTGPLSFVGIANANVARMVVGDINARGGLVGRQLELILEDSATDDAVAAAKAAKLVRDDRVDGL